MVRAGSKWRHIEDNAGLVDHLSPRARLLLWDYSRGSLPYDLLVLVLVLLVLFVSPAWLGDPMAARP